MFFKKHKEQNLIVTLGCIMKKTIFIVILLVFNYACGAEEKVRKNFPNHMYQVRDEGLKVKLTIGQWKQCAGFVYALLHMKKDQECCGTVIDQLLPAQQRDNFKQYPVCISVRKGNWIQAEYAGNNKWRVTRIDDQ